MFLSKTSSGLDSLIRSPWATSTSYPPTHRRHSLFVVPHTRLHIVWAELKGRCATKKIDLTDEAKTDDISWSRTGNRLLAITSWKHVLAQLQQAASAGGHEAIEQDIIQLRGLTDQQNTAEFLPLREDEISSATLARRLLNYTSLIDEVVGRLVADGLASIKKTGPVCDYTCVGRGVRLHLGGGRRPRHLRPVPDGPRGCA